MKTWAWILSIVIVGIVVASAYFLGYQQGKFANHSTPAVTVTASPSITASPSSVATNTTTVSAGGYSDWKTYSNNTIGYSIKYPSDWSVKEFNEYNQTIGNTVKYITVTTPDGKNFLQFGVKKPSDTFAISDRTSTGAGDIIQDTDNPVTVFGVNLIANKLVYGGKAKEYYYAEPNGGTAICKCNFTATFSYTDKADYNNLDLESTGYAAIVQKILASAAWQ